MKQILIYFSLSKIDSVKPLITDLKAFNQDKEAEQFLARLAKIKMQLAFRCAGDQYNKPSDAFKRVTSGTSCELKKAGRKASDKNVYKLSIEIIHS